MPSLPRPLAPMPLSDAMFLVGESRRQPMHTGLLMLFEPGPEGPPDMAGMYARLMAARDIQPLLCKRPVRSVRSLGQWAWEVEPDIELEHHVRRSALPGPGRPRELLELTGRLHATLLDQRRPLWEAHLIEGVSEQRWAVYSKVHHSLLDGVAGLQLLTRTLTADPAVREMPAPWERRARFDPQTAAGLDLPAADDGRAGRHGPVPAAVGRLPGLAGTVGEALTATVADVAADSRDRARDLGASVTALAGEAAGLLPAVVKAVRRGIVEQAAALPYTAPRTILNVEISSSRRFAADSWELARVRAVAHGFGGTVNDVVLAMCSGALRGWLADLGALPDASLVAMVPMNLRDADTPADGNAIAAILANLGTDLAGAEERMERVHDSVDAAKRSFEGLTQTQALALSAPGMLPFALDRVLPGTSTVRPPFNIVISNVPGPAEQLYWDGSPLRGLYPLSIPLDGQAMNITVVSNHDQLGFGIVGCRRNAPHLQRLLGGLESELVALEKAYA